jgi:hypothetical protein
MNMPRPDDSSRQFFRDVLPDDPLVQSRPMFGNVAAFVNGNMFSGLFGDRVFVRLPPDARAELLAVDDASPFEPMPGRPMAEYVVLPGAWRGEPETARQITARLGIPTIGIGSGNDCDGQILVTHDLIGLYPWFTPKFVSPEVQVAEEIRRAARIFAERTRGAVR